MHHVFSLIMSMLNGFVSAGIADDETNLTFIVGVSAGGVVILVMSLVIVLALLNKRISTMKKGNQNTNLIHQ